MSLVSVARYRAITLDNATDAAVVSARIEEATELIQEELGGRLLEESERTERCLLEPDPSGWTTYRAYPLATPITAVPDGSPYAIEDTVTVRDVSPETTPFWLDTGPAWATITYTGGFTSDTVPRTIERAIAYLAQALATTSGIPLGATSIRQGDSAITFKGETSGLDALVPGISKSLKKYRRNRRLSAPGYAGRMW